MERKPDILSYFVMAACLSIWVVFILMLVVEVPHKVGHYSANAVPAQTNEPVRHW